MSSIPIRVRQTDSELVDKALAELDALIARVQYLHNQASGIGSDLNLLIELRARFHQVKNLAAHSKSR
jgi:hypothetical protein